MKVDGMIRVAILTVSDRSSRGEREDLSGPMLAKIIDQAPFKLQKTALLPDEFEQIREILIAWSDSGDIDLILTTGGTGFAPRDITPEATLAVIEKNAPGLAEAMRQVSMKITPHAMLSRSVAGIRKSTLIVNLPGSPKAAKENFETVFSVLPHAIELLQNSPTSEAGHTKI
jgi:molybdopterin adenylyltransferase